jgi:hypothetical protein
VLPARGWATYEAGLRAVGEQRAADGEIVEFLCSLKLAAGEAGELTDAGRRFFHLEFIEEDAAAATDVLRHQLLAHCPEVAAICQLLANRPKVARGVAETVLRSPGHGDGLTDRKLGALLALMARAEIIDYAKREGTFRVLAKPLDEPELPNSIFISPDTPASNRIWLRRVLGEGSEFIYWIDKHFLPEGLDFIAEAANGAHISVVRVISLALSENETRKAKRAYRDLARELGGRGIEFEWRFIESIQVRDTHDRWIITQGRSWNVPNLNAILSGQRSEILASGNTSELRGVFEEVWEKAAPRPAGPTA